MTATPKRETMTADAFLEWAEAQASGHYQLIGGEIVAMAPERLEHSYVKFQVAKALDAAIASAKLPCRAFVDGPAVKIDDATVFEPDALVNCGPPPRRSSLIAPNPVIVVEAISPTSEGRDMGSKYAHYFRHPSIQHYIIIFIETRIALLHSRAEGGLLSTRIAGIGETLTLDPPGISLAVTDLFGDLSDALAD